MVDRRKKKADFQAAVRSSDPYALARVLVLPAVNSQQRQVEPNPTSQESFQDNGLDWGAVLTNWLDTWEFVEAGCAVKAYERQAALHTAFNQLFGSSVGSKLVPALHSVCRNSHRLAIAADTEANSQEHAKLQNAVTLLQESFSRTYNDRKELRPGAPFDEEGSKKAGVLLIVNELFAIYFRLNTLRLCKNLLRPVETRKLHETGNMGDMVTYRYYVGRLNLFEDQYEAAEQNLEFALKYCHKDAVRNKKRILHYLIPVKLYRGRLPSAGLLEKYQLVEYSQLVDGIRKGDLRKFNDALLEYQHVFIRQGTYLLLEKCKTVAYRNLFKRIHVVLDKHQISLAYVAYAFKWLGIPIDLDEIECILANLIYRGYVRGYLSHTKRVLVLSKRDPFPVSAVIAN